VWSVVKTVTDSAESRYHVLVLHGTACCIYRQKTVTHISHICAVTSCSNCATGVVGGKKSLDACKAKFAAAEGDLITYLNVHRAWLEHGKSHRW
jgi:hypothetical protein